VPLVFAWVSTNPRRWSRVERVLGREPVGKEPPRWLFGAWMVLGIAYIAVGLIQAQTSKPDGFPWINLVIGAAWILNGVTQYLIYRRRAAKASVQPQVEHGAEPRRPRPGG
jgi:hypothetical protein